MSGGTQPAMVSVGRSPRGLRARAAAWAQGARRAQGGRPRKRRRQRGRGPACRLPSRVSLFKAEGKRWRRGSLRQRGRGAGSRGRKWEPSALGRGWGREAPPLPAAGATAERRAPGLLRTSRARAAPGETPTQRPAERAPGQA